MDSKTLLERADRLITKADELLGTHRDPPRGVIGFPTLDSGTFAAWRSQALGFIQQAVGDGHVYATSFASEVKQGYRGSVQAGRGILQSLREDLAAGHLDVAAEDQPRDVLGILQTVAERFHQVARQLRNRHDGRSTLSVADEYDVQDLLHALLRLFFEDIRAEEHTPSYAGKSTRMDFLLKNEKVVVEVKKMRSSMSAGDVGTQLIEDTARYASHPDCEALVCFVYDPEGLLPNPRGLEADLTRPKGSLPVHVIIRP